MVSINKRFLIYFCFFLALTLNVAFWTHSRQFRAVWANVPPVPSGQDRASMALGDEQFFYRTSGIMLQNLGDVGGMSTRLEDYDYSTLGKWFMLADTLDQKSDFFPLLAAFYYGATRDKDDITVVIDYLAKVGQRPEGQKWRWLAQAVYLSRYVQKDLNRAFELAQFLAEHPNEDRPGWSYQMPAFVLNAKGEKEAAYDILMNLLIDEAENMHPNEVNFTKDYICDRLLSPEARDAHPLCSIK